MCGVYMDVSENSGTPKSFILIGFSILNHPFWGTPIFGNTHIIYSKSPRPMADGFRSFDTCLPIFQVECLQVVTRDGNRYSANF